MKTLPDFFKNLHLGKGQMIRKLINLKDLESITRLSDAEKFELASFNTDIEVQRTLLKDNQRILFALAKHTTHIEIIKNLHKIGDVFVLLKLIENQNTPIEIIEDLANHRLMWVKNEAQKELKRRTPDQLSTSTLYDTLENTNTLWVITSQLEMQFLNSVRKMDIFMLVGM
jgi:hypothetical protein